MSSGFELTLFERFELSASLLLIHQKRLGIPSEIVSQQCGDLHGGRLNWASEAQISYRLIRDLANLSSWIDTIYADQAGGGQKESKRGKRRRRAQLILTRVREFRKALRRAERSLQALLNEDKVDRRRFDRLGLRLCRSVRRLRQSRGYQLLRRLSRRAADLKKVREAGCRLTDDQVVQQRVAHLMMCVLKLLRMLRHIETSLRTQPDRQILLLLMVFAYFRVRKLFIHMEDLRRSLLSESDLEDFLVFSAGALRVEANRSLKQELRRLDQESDPDRFDDRLERSLSMLQNGFEQVFRQLFRSAGQGYVTREMLDSHQQSRLKESLHLVEDLENLHRQAVSMEKHPDDEHRRTFQERLEVFRRRSLFSLYRRDRQTVEEFENELAECPDEDIRFVAHRLSIYLSALLAQVNNRNVLSYAAQPRAECETGS
ncbi:MAG TPA: hypothetical protein VLU25_21255 [Acidobacteriota bacterium]|nr:hypothetical protein [Acidobacteriota bacterium]